MFLHTHFYFKTQIKMKKTLFLSMLLVTLISSCTKQPAAAPTDGPSFHQVITTRRSIRQYDATKTISEAEVRQLLTLTQEAPSWANTQSTKYYVALSPEKIEAVQGMIGDFNKRNVQGAPVLMVSPMNAASPAFSTARPPTRLAKAGERTTTA